MKFLETILFGGTLEHKLATENDDSHAGPAHHSIPLDELLMPGREGRLIPGRIATDSKSASRFPKKKDLVNPSERGRLLHYFANHELLAIETMAFVLLRFPDADPAFRAGVLRTLQDEQRHLALYMKRMNDFGVELGDFNLNLYFWNTLRKMRDPLDFVTEMSLTFEQANLDFACFYARLFQTEIDDPKTGELLLAVHEDEIKHVAHGVKWFNHWFGQRRDPAQSEYEFYRNRLPYPMTPRRARGNFFFSAESRKRAGMSDAFIESVRIAGGSRGKVPNYFFFNPQAELEREKTELPRSLKQKVDELAPVMLWLAREEDVVELPREPELSYLSQVFDFKGALPEIFIPDGDHSVPERGRYVAFDQFIPWAWSKSAWLKLRSLNAEVRVPPVFDEELHSEQLFSKKFWADELCKYYEYYGLCKNGLGVSALVPPQFDEVLIKRAYGTSGRGHLKIPRELLDSPGIQKKIQQIRARNEDVVIEAYYPKVCDFSIQYELDQEGRLTEFEPRFFQVDPLFQYQGAILGRADEHSFFKESQALLDQQLSEIKKAHAPVISLLREKKYAGPFGVDALIYRLPNGPLQIAPIIEVNARFTMGRVALEIEHSAQGKKLRSGVFRILTAREQSAHQVTSFVELEKKLRLEFKENFVAVTPSSSKETWVFAVFGMDQLGTSAIDRFLLK